MPTLHKENDWAIRVNGDEPHPLPHVHVGFRDGSRVSVCIATGQIMKNPPNIQAAQVVAPDVIELRWSTGETFCVNLGDLPKRNAAFAKLADPDFFDRMERDEWGHGISWPGELNLGADRLYELCREQAGLPTASEFGAWLQRNALSLSSAAESLGMTRRMMAHYRTGSKPIPKVVGLACKGWELQRATQR